MSALGCHQLSLYLLTNAFTQYELKSELSEAFSIALENFKDAVKSQSKNTRIGFSSLVLNLSAHLFMIGKVGPESGKAQVIESILLLLVTLFRSILMLWTSWRKVQRKM